MTHTISVDTTININLNQEPQFIISVNPVRQRYQARISKNGVAEIGRDINAGGQKLRASSNCACPLLPTS